MTATKTKRPQPKDSLSPSRLTPHASNLPDVSQETPLSIRTVIDVANGKIVDVPLAIIDRHKDNRHPTAAAIAEVAGSLAEHGLIEPLIVRCASGCEPNTHIIERYQILSGETRFLAAKKLKWPTIRARIVSCDDAAALRLVAVGNARRHDLNPLERAKLLKRLTDPTDKGGAGLTQDQAGDDVGLSRAAVANEIRLLRLPDSIQAAIVDGSLPASYARELITACDGPGAAPVEAAFKVMVKHVPAGIADGCTREDFVRRMASEVDDLCGDFREADKSDRGSDYLLHRPERSRRLFEPTDEETRKLGVFQFNGDEFAANKSLFLKLQKPAAAKLLAALKTKSAKSADRKDAKSAKEKKRTPAEQKALDKKHATQLAKRVEDFNYDWIRVLVAGRLRNPGKLDPKWRLLRAATITRLLMWAAIEPPHWREHREGALPLAGQTEPWDKLCRAPDEQFDSDELPARFLANLFADDNGPTQAVPPEVVNAAAKSLCIDRVAAWKADRAGPLTDRFFEMLNRQNLTAQADAWGIDIRVAAKVSELQAEIQSNPKSKASLPILLRGKK